MSVMRMPLETPSLRDGLRPLDPLRDMAAVLDLIEVGFATELDPQGWRMLAQMRRLVGKGLLGQAAYARQMDSTGFVWLDQGRIVGNLSLRYALPHSSRGRMIGNVVVHPDYRGAGIGRALMESAIAAARESGARWIGLEVREDNAPACTLYRHLGFDVVGRIQHLLRPAGKRWPVIPSPQQGWVRSLPSESGQWRWLADAIFGRRQKRVLEIHAGSYRYGDVQRRIESWLNRQREGAWLWGGDSAQLAVRTKTDLRYHFHVWDLLVHPDSDGDAGAREAIACAFRAVWRHRSWPVIALIPDQAFLAEALTDVGFGVHRILQQMILDL